MRRMVATIAVIVTVLSGLTASPARATTVKVITLTGFANFGSGFGYPGVGGGGTIDPDKIPCTTGVLPDPSCFEVKTGPKGEPQMNFRPEGNHAGFSFNSTVCVKVSVSDLKKAPGPGLCLIRAAGAVWGYCGLSTGIGVATIDNLNPPPLEKATVSTDIKFTDVGGVWYITGGGSLTWISGVLAAHPTPSTPGGPSCSSKTANQFLFEGQLYYKDIN